MIFCEKVKKYGITLYKVYFYITNLLLIKQLYYERSANFKFV